MPPSHNHSVNDLQLLPSLKISFFDILFRVVSTVLFERNSSIYLASAFLFLSSCSVNFAFNALIGVYCIPKGVGVHESVSFSQSPLSVQRKCQHIHV